MLYRLIIYLMDHNRLFYIDDQVGELEELNLVAAERKLNNPNYVAIIGTYNIDSAILM